MTKYTKWKPGMHTICQKYDLENIMKEPGLSSEFYKWMRREIVYTSNAIELNKLTREETEEVLSENGKKPINKNKDSIETINLANTLDKSLNNLKNGKKINEEFIMSIHSGIIKDIDDSQAGFYRNCGARPLRCCFSYSNYVKIPTKMAELVDFINNPKIPVFDMAIEAHYKFVKVHPFSDGNGRTARLLMNIILMNNGIIPIFIYPETRNKYIDVLGVYGSTKDGSLYKKFMEESFYNSALTVCNFLMDNKIR